MESQKIQSKPGPLWKETISEEIKAYIGIRLFMAIKKLPETKMYWSDDDVFGPPNQSKIPNKDHADFDKLLLVRPVLGVVKIGIKCFS